MPSLFFVKKTKYFEKNIQLSKIITIFASEIRTTRIMVARITYKSKNVAKYVKNAVIRDGYLTDNTGKAYLNEQFFSSLSRKDADDLENKIRDFLEDKFCPISAMIGSEFEHCLLKFGDNGDAFVSDYESDLRNGKAELYFVFYQFGFQCDNPVPESIWDKCFKPYATYHAGTADEEDFLEDCDIYDQPAKGWFYSRGVLEALKAEGIRYIVQ